MRIESGSQNLSRTPGVFVYPLHRYNPNPVEGVDQIRRAPDQSRHMRGIGSDGRPDPQARIETSRKSEWSEELTLTYAPPTGSSRSRRSESARGSNFDLLA